MVGEEEDGNDNKTVAVAALGGVGRCWAPVAGKGERRQNGGSNDGTKARADGYNGQEATCNDAMGQ